MTAGTTAVAVVAALCTLAGASAASAAGSTSGSVSGIAFRDFSADGVYDTGHAPGSGLANDLPLAGVGVTAVDRDGTTVATATTDASGAYTLAVAGAATDRVRVEFALSAAQLAEGYFPGAHGADSGTSVQFAQLGQTDVDFAALVPEDYIQASPRVAVAAQRPGDPLAAGYPATAADAGLFSSVVTLDYEANSTDAAAPTTESSAFEGAHGVATGSVYALAAPKGAGAFYAGAVLRRHVGLGEAGMGAIYRIDPVSHSASLLVDLDNGSGTTTGGNIDVGERFFSDALGSSGSATDNALRDLTADPAAASHDIVAWDNVGKLGLGGVAASTDGTTLYAINLFTKSLIVIDIATGSAQEVSLGSLSPDQRPFAVAVHRGKVFVGITDTAESTGLRGDLGASVVVTPEASVTTPTWTPALSVSDLSFARGAASDGAFGTPDWTNSDAATHWNAWTDDWNAGEKSLFAPSGQTWTTNAQPLLSTLAFDASGNLVLGFLDRYSFMGGMGNYAPLPGDTGHYSAIAAGGVYGASPNGDGTFTLEDNATLGGVASGGVDNGFGPGGGQFYVSRSGAHTNSFTGAVAAAPGYSSFLATGYDLSGGWTSDAGWMPVDGGETLTNSASWISANRAQRIIDNAADNGSPTTLTPGMGKAGGLGGVAVLARLAPVEIGNRVWFDADQDGVQDADEPSVAGVTVSLTDASGNPVVDADGNPVAPVVTGADGEYYFSNLVPNRTYTVTFATPTTGTWDGGAAFGPVPWTAMSFTDQAQGGNSATDSNVDAAGVATVAVGGPGQNDHTIDAGLVADVTFTVTKRIASGGAAPLTGQTFTIDVAGRDFRGLDYAVAPASVTLAADATSPAITVPIGTRVRVSESGDDSIVSYVATYGTQTADADGFALVVGTGAAPTPVEVTNTLRQPGTFSITKTLDDPSVALGELGSTTFAVAVAVNGTPAGTVQLSAANGFAYTSGAYPVGTAITLTETGETGSPAWAQWGTPSWSTGDADGDGTAEIVVGEGANAALTLTNDITVLTGGFDVLKDVTGAGADRVPDDFVFTLEFSVDGGTTWAPLQLTDGETVDGPQDLRVGTVVQVREVAPTGPDDVTWQTPVFSGTGVTPGQPATLTIGAAGEVHVLLENPTEPSNGQFSLLKDVTGAGEPLLAPGTVFPVTFSYPGQPGGAQTVNLVNGTPWSSPALPTGTVVTVTESAPTGGLPDGASWGTPSLEIDGVAAPNGATLTIGADETVAVVVDNPTDVTPSVELTKGDGDAGSATIMHEADSVDTGEAYRPGETRTIVIRVTNTGPEPLREVDLSDLTTAGGAIAALRWSFPDLSSTDAVWDAASGTWSAAWGATFAPGTTTWAVGDVIVGTATLTLNGSDDPHQDIASVSAKGAFSGKTVGDDNPYNAFTGGIQVIKYDGQKPDPLVGGPGGWITPTKPLVNGTQDANTPQTAVVYPVDKAQKVRWVVTNTGKTWLTNLTLVDVTSNAPAIGSDWTADLSAFGGPSDYSFLRDGAWPGLFPPGASFFAEGTLTMPAGDTHADTVTVTGTLVVPKPDPTTGLPTSEPLLDGSGTPVIAKDGSGAPIVFTDDDPFHARTPAPPLAITGSEAPWAAGGLAAAMLLLGAAIVLLAGWRRRTRRGH